MLGNESFNDYDNNYYWEGNKWDNYGGSLGNVTMLLEKGENSTTENAIAKATIEKGEFDPLRNARQAKPISVQNGFEAFREDSEAEDENDEDVHKSCQPQVCLHSDTIDGHAEEKT